MTPKERLLKVQERLIARGVKDIKFCWAENVHTKTRDEIYTDVSMALEAYLDGKYHPLPDFNDRPTT